MVKGGAKTGDGDDERLTSEAALAPPQPAQAAAVAPGPLGDLLGFFKAAQSGAIGPKAAP